MNATEFLLCVIEASGGRIQGRTLLQKRAFFLAELTGIDAGLRFDAHYYGPYSATVEGTVTQLKNLGFVQESNTGFGILKGGFEVKRYDYSLTEDGKVLVELLRETPEYFALEAGMRKMADAGDPNYLELSIAAKAYFLLKKKRGKMGVSELLTEAEKYNWTISPESIRRAVDFLKALGVAKEA